jgi:hypothetical protein
MNTMGALGRYSHPGVSVDAQRICNILGDLALHWIGSATGQARIAEPLAALYQLYERCQVQDWDGEDAEAISFEALIEAEKLLRLLPSSIPMPEFLPEPTGSIAFEWYRGRNHVYVLSIAGKKAIEFAGLLGQGNEIHGRTNFEDSLPPAIQAQLREFFRQ